MLSFEYHSRMSISKFYSLSHKVGSIKNSVKKGCCHSANYLPQTNLLMLHSRDLVFVSIAFDASKGFQADTRSQIGFYAFLSFASFPVEMRTILSSIW